MRMRSSLVPAVALLSAIVATNVAAQEVLHTRFGMLVGASIASITDTDVTGLDEVPGIRIDSRRRVGFQLGAYYTHPVAGSLSIQPEVHYVQKGLRLESRGSSSGSQSEPSGTIDVNLAYVELPVLLRYDVARGRRIRPFLVAGPAVGFRANCRFAVASGDISSDQTCDPDMGNTTPEDEDPLKRYEVGGIVGIGVQGSDGGRTISAQLRYAHGFTTIAKDAGEASPRNTGISVVFGIGF